MGGPAPVAAGFAVGFVLALAAAASLSRRRVHPTGISARVARVLTQHRGGSLHVFGELQARTTALVVIDMQETFLTERNRHLPLWCPRGRQIVAFINRAAGALRGRGGKVIWITSDVGADSLDGWSVLYGAFFPAVEGVRDSIRRSLQHCECRWGSGYDPFACSHGMDGPLAPGLEVLPADWVVKKDRFSPFGPGGCHQGCAPGEGPSGPRDFGRRLREQGIDTLLLAGVTTATCVASTAKDAMEQNFKVVVLSDACESSQLQDHVTALDHMAYLMADVRTVDDAVKVLR